MRIWKVPNIINNKMTQIAMCFSAIILSMNITFEVLASNKIRKRHKNEYRKGGNQIISI